MNDVVQLLIDTGLPRYGHFKHTEYDHWSHRYYHTLYPFYNAETSDEPYAVTILWKKNILGRVHRFEIVIADKELDVSIRGTIPRKMGEQLVNIFEEKEKSVKEREATKRTQKEQEALDRFVSKLQELLASSANKKE